MLERFSAFIKNASLRFRRIAGSIGGGITPSELHGEAWLAAEEIATKRGRGVDFANTADQELVLNRVYWNLRRQRDWRLASAYSIDDDHEGIVPWVDRLAAPLSDTPLAVLLQREATAICNSALKASYSQAAAYNIAITNFNNDLPALCLHLLIAEETLKSRMNRAIDVVRWQESLFNGREIIDTDFIPMAGPIRATTVVAHFEVHQIEFQF